MAGESRSSGEKGKKLLGIQGPPQHSQWGHLGPPPFSKHIRATRQEQRSSPVSTHFLLAGFSLFSPPFELLEGDLPFQVVDELWAEPRHVCKVQVRSPNNPEREPEGQRLPDSTPRRDAESEDRRPTGKGSRPVPQPPRSGSAGALGPTSFRRGPSGGAFLRPPSLRAGSGLRVIRGWGEVP